MANSSIEWTEVTWNPTTGCDKISAGCKFCYAEVMSRRLQSMRLSKYQNGFELNIHADTLTIPYTWKKPRIVFVNSMSDLFHKNIPLNFMKIYLIRWVNVALIWLFVHQLGFFYADGTLNRLPRWAHGLIAAVGLVALFILTNIGIFPRSMVGTGFEKVSNMNPPTVCIAALALWLIGLAMVLRGPVAKWLRHDKPWIAVIAANTMIMTLYLWHLVAFAIGYAILRVMGFGQNMTESAIFWIERPLWILVPGIILAVLVTAFQRFEKTQAEGGSNVQDRL